MKVKNYNKLLQIPKASFEDSGEYTCSATNKIGYLEHTITVRIKGQPIIYITSSFITPTHRYWDMFSIFTLTRILI
jgi:hypothetical protein